MQEELKPRIISEKKKERFKALLGDLKRSTDEMQEMRARLLSEMPAPKKTKIMVEEIKVPSLELIKSGRKR